MARTRVGETHTGANGEEPAPQAEGILANALRNAALARGGRLPAGLAHSLERRMQEGYRAGSAQEGDGNESDGPDEGFRRQTGDAEPNDSSDVKLAAQRSRHVPRKAIEERRWEREKEEKEEEERQRRRERLNAFRATLPKAKPPGTKTAEKRLPKPRSTFFASYIDDLEYNLHPEKKPRPPSAPGRPTSRERRVHEQGVESDGNEQSCPWHSSRRSDERGWTHEEAERWIEEKRRKDREQRRIEQERQKERIWRARRVQKQRMKKEKSSAKEWARKSRRAENNGHQHVADSPVDAQHKDGDKGKGEHDDSAIGIPRQDWASRQSRRGWSPEEVREKRRREFKLRQYERNEEAEKAKAAKRRALETAKAIAEREKEAAQRYKHQHPQGPQPPQDPWIGVFGGEEHSTVSDGLPAASVPFAPEHGALDPPSNQTKNFVSTRTPNSNRGRLSVRARRPRSKSAPKLKEKSPVEKKEAHAQADHVSQPVFPKPERSNTTQHRPGEVALRDSAVSRQPKESHARKNVQKMPKKRNRKKRKAQKPKQPISKAELREDEFLQAGNIEWLSDRLIDQLIARLNQPQNEARHGNQEDFRFEDSVEDRPSSAGAEMSDDQQDISIATTHDGAQPVAAQEEGELGFEDTALATETSAGQYNSEQAATHIKSVARGIAKTLQEEIDNDEDEGSPFFTSGRGRGMQDEIKRAETKGDKISVVNLYMRQRRRSPSRHEEGGKDEAIDVRPVQGHAQTQSVHVESNEVGGDHLDELVGEIRQKNERAIEAAEKRLQKQEPQKADDKRGTPDEESTSLESEQGEIAEKPEEEWNAHQQQSHPEQEHQQRRWRLSPAELQERLEEELGVLEEAEQLQMEIERVEQGQDVSEMAWQVSQQRATQNRRLEELHNEHSKKLQELTDVLYSRLASNGQRRDGLAAESSEVSSDLQQDTPLGDKEGDARLSERFIQEVEEFGKREERRIKKRQEQTRDKLNREIQKYMSLGSDVSEDEKRRLSESIRALQAQLESQEADANHRIAATRSEVARRRWIAQCLRAGESAPEAQAFPAEAKPIGSEGEKKRDERPKDKPSSEGITVKPEEEEEEIEDVVAPAAPSTEKSGDVEERIEKGSPLPPHAREEAKLGSASTPGTTTAEEQRLKAEEEEVSRQFKAKEKEKRHLDLERRRRGVKRMRERIAALENELDALGAELKGYEHQGERHSDDQVGEEIPEEIDYEDDFEEQTTEIIEELSGLEEPQEGDIQAGEDDISSEKLNDQLERLKELNREVQAKRKELFRARELKAQSKRQELRNLVEGINEAQSSERMGDPLRSDTASAEERGDHWVETSDDEETVYPGVVDEEDLESSEEEGGDNEAETYSDTFEFEFPGVERAGGAAPAAPSSTGATVVEPAQKGLSEGGETADEHQLVVEGSRNGIGKREFAGEGTGSVSGAIEGESRAGLASRDDIEELQMYEVEEVVEEEDDALVPAEQEEEEEEYFEAVEHAPEEDMESSDKATAAVESPPSTPESAMLPAASRDTSSKRELSVGEMATSALAMLGGAEEGDVESVAHRLEQEGAGGEGRLMAEATVEAREVAGGSEAASRKILGWWANQELGMDERALSMAREEESWWRNLDQDRAEVLRQLSYKIFDGLLEDAASTLR